MAFHPFRYFRKHQKAFFAFLILICMITFIFQFGAADPIQRVLYWIGASRGHGYQVTTLYGKKIYQSDVDRLERRRYMANEFLLFGAAQAYIGDGRSTPPAIGELRARYQRTRPTDNQPNPVQRALQAWDDATGMMAQFQMTPEQRYQRVLFSLRMVEQDMDQPDVTKNPDYVKALDTIATGLALVAWDLNRQLKNRRDEYYMGGSRKPEDALDFYVWKHEADRLGIVLTQADICREINRAWGNRDAINPDHKFDSNDWVRRYFSSTNRAQKDIGPKDLLEALGDELRVAMAKEAILGEGPGVRFYRTEQDGIHNSPAVATPDEFYRYYQKQRTTLAVRMLAIPVAELVKKVSRKPAEQELVAFYNRYKDDEPSPTRSEPGFKEPRRVKVQYFSFSPDSPFYKKLAAEMTKFLPLFRLGGPVNTYPASGGVAAWAANVAVPLSYDAGLLAQYEAYQNEERDRVSFNHFGVGFDFRNPRDARLQAPLATVGGTPLTAAVGYLATTELYEKATLSAFASSVLAGASASPFEAMTLPVPFLHTRQPFEAVRGQMRERFEQGVARALVRENMETVVKEMAKLRRPDQAKQLEQYVAKAVKDYGLENYHSMAEAQTRQEILDTPDPALKVLRDGYQNAEDDSFMRTLQRRPARPDFVGALFAGGIGLFSPESQFKVKSKDETFFFWRIEDRPAHVRPFEKIRAEVEKAWYFDRARQLARKDAERIDAELKAKHLNPDDAVSFLVEQKVGPVLPRPGANPEYVAHLIARPDTFIATRPRDPADFKPYKVPSDLIAYPPSDFVDRLLKLKERGASLVLEDQPQKHFYVVVLLEKPVLPSRQEFFDIYRNSRAEDPIWGQMMKDRRKEYQQKLLEQLRAEAGPVDEQGAWVLPDDLRRRAEGGGESAE